MRPGSYNQSTSNLCSLGRRFDSGRCPALSCGLVGSFKNVVVGLMGSGPSTTQSIKTVVKPDRHSSE